MVYRVAYIKKSIFLQSLDKTEKIIIKMVSFLAIVVEPRQVKKMVKDWQRRLSSKI